ncbi:MAG TPA: hypothetical protein VFR81_18395 [Longimicrobium sp.]|nr:hypothetical protein [Longimicrobium sp.]
MTDADHEAVSGGAADESAARFSATLRITGDGFLRGMAGLAAHWVMPSLEMVTRV